MAFPKTKEEDDDTGELGELVNENTDPDFALLEEWSRFVVTGLNEGGDDVPKVKAKPDLPP